jgi:hypothetical protein
VRGEKVMLDVDLAKLYGVPTKALNQAVKRNAQRFPPDFMFQLTGDEVATLISQFVISKSPVSRATSRLRSQFVTTSGRKTLSRSQNVTLKRGHNIKYLPYAFTEQGVAMLSSVLRSERAVQVNTTCGDAVG